MKKWIIIMVGALTLVAALGAVTAEQEDTLSDEEMLDLIDDIETACQDADCAQDEPITAEQVEALGFDSILIDDAWGICAIEGGGGEEQTCVCTEPEPPGPPTAPLPDETALYVGKQYGIALYDTLACKGLYYDGTGWTWTVAGGCRKFAGGLEHLEVLGNQSTAIDEDNVGLIWEESSAGDCDFANWWINYWDSVTADGQDGTDDVRGSPQGDVLEGEKILGYAGDDEIHLTAEITNPIAYGGNGDDTIHGTDNDDYLYGGNDDDTLWGYGGYDTLDGQGGSDDYCDCGEDSDPAAGAGCDTDTGCDD